MNKPDPKFTTDYLSRKIQETIRQESSNNQSIDPFLKYIGSKQEIFDSIAPFFPDHKVYVEPFCGSASIFFKKPKSDSNILNDYNGDLTNLFSIVRDYRDEFIELIWLTPYSEELHRKIYRAYFNKDIWNGIRPLKKAFGFYYLMQSAFNESFGNLNSPSFKLGTGKQKWSQDICKLIYNCAKKLDNVIIMNQNYQKLSGIDGLNIKQTFWYMDPPYTMADDKKYYQHNFTPSSHHELMIVCKSLKANFMISYDDSPLIRQIFKDFEIRKLRKFDNEIIICNYDIQSMLKQKSLFKVDESLI